MSLLSSLFKSSKKVNLTPDVTPLMPSQINPERYNELSKLSSKLIGGPGFGDEFVSKSGNPQASRMRADFQNYTSPFLSSQASARGIGRSSLALDQQRRSYQETESNIDQLMADLYKMNEIQKKSDTQFGAQLGQNILSGDVAQQNQVAAASERLANATAADARGREAADKSTAGNLLGAATMIAAPALEPLGIGIGNVLNSFGLSSLTNAARPIGEILNQGVTKIGTKTLDDLDSNSARNLSREQIVKLLQEYLGG